MIFVINHTASTHIYTLSLHDALPIFPTGRAGGCAGWRMAVAFRCGPYSRDPETRDERRFAPRGPSPGEWLWPWCQRSEEHTSELQSRENLVCRLLLEKKKIELYEDSI